MMEDLTTLTAAAAGRMIAARTLSPVDLVEAFLARIEAVDAQVKSYLLVMADSARAAARLAEQEIAAGKWRGPLHGIPYAVKDNYFTKGVRTCGASRLLLDHVPDFNATAIERLTHAGAILLGKLNTWEYGTGTGAVHFDLPFEPACNPWNLGHFTGGSSTGAGASVAARTAMFALGSDTGGSVRLPAAACGLQGIKPSFGLVSRYGILPNCWSLDAAGPLCWTAQDCALVLDAIAGHDLADPTCVDRPPVAHARGIGAGVQGTVIGIVRDIDMNGIGADPAVAAGVSHVAETLQSLGARIVDVALPSPLSAYRRVTSLINWTESLSIHERDFTERGDQMGQALRDKMMSGFTVRAVDYVAALRLRRELAETMDRLMQSVDALLLPCAFHTAPAYADPAAVVAFTGHTATSVFNATGHPAISLCSGFDAAGLPLSAQLAGNWFDEATLLRITHAYEQATPWRAARPEIPAQGAMS
jgi:aspartyl-tRNA(Asn)/glutamyl-tRNA(Gln) amidotransferase subunit A